MLLGWDYQQHIYFFSWRYPIKWKKNKERKKFLKIKKKVPSIPGTFKHSLRSHGKKPEISAGARGPEQPQTTLTRSRNAAATFAYPITKPEPNPLGGTGVTAFLTKTQNC